MASNQQRAHTITNILATPMPLPPNTAKRIKQAHQRLQRPSIHAAARTANLHAWIQTAHPGALDTNAVPMYTGYLADLYPAIWTHGPHGETYLAQLTRIHTLLTTPGFLNDALTAMNHMDPIFDSSTIIPDLQKTATREGTPLPGDAILYGMDLTDQTNAATVHQSPIEQILNDPDWLNHRSDIYLSFEDFIYRFALTTIHHTYFTNLDNELTRTLLHDYNTFCMKWGIPTP